MEKMDFKRVNITEIKDMIRGLEKYKWCLIIAGLLMVLLGIYSMFHPARAILSLAVFLGVGFAVSGVNHVLAYFAHFAHKQDSGWFLAQGIFEIVLGFVLLANLGVTALSIPIMVAFWAMMDGVMRVTSSLQLKKIGVQKWWVLLVSGIISILFAFLLLARPFAGVIAVTFLVGITLFMWGVTVLFEIYHIHGVAKAMTERTAD